ncbi:hypothetical protein STENM36S_06548 [Streptomyces tendae]
MLAGCACSQPISARARLQGRARRSRPAARGPTTEHQSPRRPSANRFAPARTCRPRPPDSVQTPPQASPLRPIPSRARPLATGRPHRSHPPPRSPSRRAPPPGRDRLPFASATTAGLHNTYSPTAFRYLAQGLDTGTGMIEIDTWPDNTTKQWKVSHSHPHRNVNNCTPATTAAQLYSGTTHSNLETCLDDVRIWLRAHPGAGPLVVKLERTVGAPWVPARPEGGRSAAGPQPLAAAPRGCETRRGTAGAVRVRQGRRAGPVRPSGADRAQSGGGRPRGAGADVHAVAGRRRSVWSVGLILAGYALGSSVPNIDRHLLPLVALIVVVSLLPLLAELYRAHRARRGGDSDSEKENR